MEILPPTLDISSSVHTFFGFFLFVAGFVTPDSSLPAVVFVTGGGAGEAGAGGGCVWGAGLAGSDWDCAPVGEEGAAETKTPQRASIDTEAIEGRTKPSNHQHFGDLPVQEVYRRRNQGSAESEPDLPNSACPSSLRMAERASLGGPM